MTKIQGLPQGEFDLLVRSIMTELEKITTRAKAQIQAAMLKHAPILGRCSDFQLEVLEREIGAIGIRMSWRDFLRKMSLMGRGEMTQVVALHEGITYERFVALKKSDQQMLNSGRIPVRIRNVDQVVKIETLTRARLYRIVTRLGVLEPSKQDLRIPRIPRYYSIVYSCRTRDGQIMLVCRCNRAHDIKVVTTVEQLQKIIRDHESNSKVKA